MYNEKEIEKLRAKKSRRTGILMTFAFHLAVLSLFSFSGFKYIYPPPEEKTILLDFSEVAEMTMEEYGRTPQAEQIDPEEAVKLVQKSESVDISERPNLSPEAESDQFGDVLTPDPKQPEINQNALFPGMAKKDTSIAAPHTASQISETFKAGQPQGNTKLGKTSDRPNAQLKGRNTIGNMPYPVYNVQESGIVVVDIWVDNYGTVVKAVPGGDGTTVNNKTLYAAARKAALETHFNMDGDAPATQEGTITYIFNLK